MIEVLTTGQKIKRLRLILGLTQKDITNGILTRNYISMIENDKEHLSVRAAEIISNVMNKAIHDKNLAMNNITVSYLMQDTKVQIAKSFNEKLANLQENIGDVNLFEKIKEDIFELINTYELEFNDVVKFYNTLIFHYSRIADYENHEKYTLELFVMARKDKNITLENLCRLIINYTETNKQKQAVAIRELALKMAQEDEISPNMRARTYFNCAISYEREKNEKCLPICDKILKELDIPHERKLDIFFIKAEYYIQINQYVNCLEVLEEIEKKNFNLDRDTNGLLQRMYVVCYINLGELERAKDIIDNKIEVLPDDERYLYQVYEAKFFYCIKTRDGINISYDRALTYARKLNDNKSILLLHKTLMEYSVKNKENSLLNLMAKSLAEDLKTTNYHHLFKLHIKLIQHLKLNNRNLLEKHLKNLENF